ncbi:MULTISPECIES: hypothetical protein [Paenibacillus]|uniref:hypothetical protein n=1 Tax=Paenibacillus TaxID=44249 RepID=UPI0009A68C90|nr:MULTISPECIES: hypothetical protein [Paenibacillus]MCZ1267401.1 hypothetical protein [Paenibacillus tundrae]SLK16697.1 hypothetical protein SAMN06272722_110225 [Paenibacillus sp. RU5A]SOC74439.1 hypothetical protein SAMN05880581_110225 [Paenibacillus sp. RU26A]SOC76612.1 hypothetical protein SAMN05880586_110225 [Paenibacillus sp. RU5M]
MIKEKSGLEKILSRIEQEKVTVVEIDNLFDEENPLHYYAVVRRGFGGTYITVPKHKNLRPEEHLFAIAHELGHIILRRKWSNSMNYWTRVSRSMMNQGHLIGILLVLVEELYAWIEAFKTCKENEIDTTHFISQSIYSLTTYFMFIPRTIYKLAKQVLGIYLGAFFFVKVASMHPQMQSYFELFGVFNVDFKWVMPLFQYLITVFLIGLFLKQSYHLIRSI